MNSRLSQFVLLLTVAVASMSWAQATVEYGLIMSKSAASPKIAAGSAAGQAGKRLTDALQGQAPKSAPKGAATGQIVLPDPLNHAMRANRLKLEAEARQNGAALQISSVPNDTFVVIDGAPVAHAPANLLLPAGKHRIALTHPAFLPWQQELSLTAGETVRLEPKLERRDDKRIVFISFDK